MGGSLASTADVSPVQVNLSEMVNGRKGIRQHGFQECDIVSMARPVTKYRQTMPCACYFHDTPAMANP